MNGNATAKVGLELVRHKGGRFAACSCSGRVSRAYFDEIVAAATDSGRQVQILARQGAGRAPLARISHQPSIVDGDQRSRCRLRRSDGGLDIVMGTLGGSPNPPALWLRRAKPACANAFASPPTDQLGSLL
jgi:hypothetical protein